MSFSSWHSHQNDHQEYFTIMSLQLYFPRSPLLGTIKMIVNQNRFVDHHIFSATRRSDVVSGWIFWRKKRLLSLPALLSLTLTFVLFFSFIRWPCSKLFLKRICKKGNMESGSPHSFSSEFSPKFWSILVTFLVNWRNRWVFEWRKCHQFWWQ